MAILWLEILKTLLAISVQIISYDILVNHATFSKPFLNYFAHNKGSCQYSGHWLFALYSRLFSFFGHNRLVLRCLPRVLRLPAYFQFLIASLHNFIRTDRPFLRFTHFFATVTYLLERACAMNVLSFEQTLLAASPCKLWKEYAIQCYCCSLGTMLTQNIAEHGHSLSQLYESVFGLSLLPKQRPQVCGLLTYTMPLAVQLRSRGAPLSRRSL